MRFAQDASKKLRGENCFPDSDLAPDNRSRTITTTRTIERYLMITTFFLGFVALMTAIIVLLSARYRNRRFAFGVLAILGAWFLYIGVLGYLGVIANRATVPPGIALIFVPVVVFFVVFIVRVGSSPGAGVALAFPLWVLIGTQAFRVGVEMFIHQLWIDGLVPKMLTFAGANVDIYIGASALVIAWLSMRGWWGQRLALLWNVLGLLSLANVVTRAVLTAPGPLNLIHTEVPNRMIGTFPFMFIPGFFVPLAVVLHVLAIRSITSQVQAGPDRPL
jgi:hypothetical protein